MSFWKPPHKSKIYEALSAIADNRIILVDQNTTHCTSTSRGKYYTTTFDPTTLSIMSNDNTAFYTKSVSYPMIAHLMLQGIILYDRSLLSPLANIPWKDINQKFKNDYDKSIAYYYSHIFPSNLDATGFQAQIETIYQQVCTLELRYLGSLVKPSSVY